MTHVYVAGAYRERDRVQREMQRVRSHPKLVLAYDWIANITEYCGGDQAKEAELSPEDRLKFAEHDIECALRSDVFWFPVPEVGGRGCWFEAGAVQHARSNLVGPVGSARFLPVTVASGPHVGVSIFSELLDYKFSSDQEAFEFIATKGWE